MTGSTADIGQRVAAAAQALIGARFRLYGRHPDHGLDCVGVVACALAGAGIVPCAPTGYRLRNTGIAALLDAAAMSGLAPAAGMHRPGDILLVRPGPAQHHLHVALDPRRSVHAHAGLRLVVEHRGPIAGPVLRHWRPQIQG